MPKRTDEEKKLVEKAFRYMPAGSLGNVIMKREEAFLIARGKGSRVWDSSGNEYIDYLLGSGPQFLGHANPEVTAAIKDALDKGSTFFHTSEAAVRLAEEIVKAVPCAEQVRFTSSGTEADLQAMRIARAFRKRDKILKFEGGYHGTSDYGWVSITHKETPAFPFAAIPESAGIPKAALDLILVAPFNDLETTASIIEKHHDELAAVIVEPVQRILPPVPGFLKGLREITARYGVVLIFDEVVTGFRMAYGGAQEVFDIVPDMATYGKVIGGGMALAAVAGSEEVMSVCNSFVKEKPDFVSMVGTLSGNPVSASAGLAALKIVRRPGFYEKVNATGRKLMNGLSEAFARVEIPALVTGFETCFDVYFIDRPVRNHRDALKTDSAMHAKYHEAMLKRGILKGHLKYYVGPCHTEEDVAKTLKAFDEVAEELRRLPHG
ncbi:MAG: aminotransferase class III-fold pyridoxal phosphate-dependent enzyme [Desulfobacteraceae bacterium]|nr:MAG: aminotransferase class III-fold pyridoxal phosphate-dependent enzyme [Desulfobacteraceae bacterium]